MAKIFIETNPDPSGAIELQGSNLWLDNKKRPPIADVYSTYVEKLHTVFNSVVSPINFHIPNSDL